jgi:hypothetical protein
MLPPINLLNYAKQRGDYEMSDIEETGISSHYETHIKPIWKPKPVVQSANDMQVDGNHYKEMSIQPWDVMESVLTTEEFVGFLKGNIIKYAMRDGKKFGSVKDAAKAKHYQAKLAEMEEYR